MKTIEQKIINFSDRLGLISAGDRILVAFSGGPDSVFLLFILEKFKKRFKIELGAFHLNHLLRKEAGKDEEFCREFCANFGIPFFSIRKKVKSYSEKKKVSLEEAGRIIRYEELSRTAFKNNFNKIATAHNADDNAETVLLNLIKGSGLRGMSGIPPVRENIIRPILPLKKNEVLDYLSQNKIKYRIDESNESLEFERNFLRRKVIPQLRQLNPSLEETILKSSEVFRNQFRIVERFVENSSDNLAEMREGKLYIYTDKFTQPIETAGDLFKNLVERNFSVEIRFNDIKRIVSLIGSHRSKRIELSSGIVALKESSELILYRETSEEFPSVELKPGSSVRIGKKTLTITEEDFYPVSLGHDNYTEYIDARTIDGDFILRKWENGDRFFPIGMKGTKKISDFLNDRKLSFIEKEKQLVLTHKNQIVWVVGLRLDNRFKLTESTEKVLKLCLK